MKIAHVFWSLSFGGIETLLVNISNWQAMNGHEVSIFIINDNIETTLLETLDNRINIFNLKRKDKSKNPWSFIKLNFLLLKHNFDVLHIHCAGIGKIILSLTKSKTILHVHNTKIDTKKLPKVNKYIVISNAVKKMLEARYGITKSECIYNGINFDLFARKMNQKLSNKIINIGRLDVQHKNQDGLIREFDKIKNVISANLYIVGDGNDMLRLKKLIKELQLEERVFLLGTKDQFWIQTHLFEYDLFIQASHYEGLGITAIEASAAGVPMLLSNVDGHLEISENGRLCELFNPTIKEDLGNKIIDFYRNPDKYFKQASSSYAIQKRRFNLELYNEKLLKIYMSLLNKI